MRLPLRWLLALTLTLSAVAVWWPQPGSPALVTAVRRDAEQAPMEQVGLSSHRRSGAEAAPLPKAIPSLHVDQAHRDIFASAAAIPKPLVSHRLPLPDRQLPLPPPPQLLVKAQQATPAVSPESRMRYVGSMLTPAGDRLVLIARGEAAFIARPGLHVEDGYTIQSIEAGAVRLIHTASGSVMDIPIPVPAQPLQFAR